MDVKCMKLEGNALYAPHWYLIDTPPMLEQNENKQKRTPISPTTVNEENKNVIHWRIIRRSGNMKWTRKNNNKFIPALQTCALNVPRNVKIYLFSKEQSGNYRFHICVTISIWRKQAKEEEEKMCVCVWLVLLTMKNERK